MAGSGLHQHWGCGEAGSFKAEKSDVNTRVRRAAEIKSDLLPAQRSPWHFFPLTHDWTFHRVGSKMTHILLLLF